MPKSSISLVIVSETMVDGVRFTSDDATILSFIKEYQDDISSDYDCLIVSDMKMFKEYCNLPICNNIEELLKTLIIKGIKV